MCWDDGAGKYTGDAKIYYYVVEWDESACSWSGAATAAAAADTPPLLPIHTISMMPLLEDRCCQLRCRHFSDVTAPPHTD